MDFLYGEVDEFSVVCPDKLTEWLESNPSEDSKGYALYQASRIGDVKVAKRLLEAGADIHYEDDDALVEAVFMGYDDIAEVLLAAGANIFAQFGILIPSEENGFEVMRRHMRNMRNLVWKRRRVVALFAVSALHERRRRNGI